MQKDSLNLKCLLNFKKCSSPSSSISCLRSLKSDTAIFDKKYKKSSLASLTSLPCKLTTERSCKKELRPLQDKLYQLQLTQILENHLVKETDFFLCLNNGKLKPMTVKVFVELTSKLLEELDINETLTTKNYTEKLPPLSAVLCYPGTMHKSWLKTVNAIHSWPNVLGWLSWLLAVVDVKKKATKLLQIETIPFAGASFYIKEKRKSILKLILACKRRNNEGNLAAEQKLIRDYLKQEEETHNSSDDNLMRLKARLLDLEHKRANEEMLLNNFNKENEIFKCTLKSVDDRMNEQEKTLKVKLQNFNDIQNVQAKIDGEIALIKYDVEEKHVAITQLKNSLEMQEIMLSQKDNTIELIVESKRTIAELNQTLVKLTDENFSLTQSIQQKNDRLLKLIGSRRNNFFDSHINVKMHSDMEFIELMKISEKQNVKLQKEMENKIEEVNCEIEAKKLRLISKNEEFNSIFIEEKQKEEEMMILKKKTDDVKKKCENEENQRKIEIKKLQEELDEIKSNIPDLEDSKFKLIEAKLKLEALQNRKIDLKNKMKAFFATLLKVKFHQE